MKNDLSKVKVGDKIWTIQEGWTKVTKINEYSYPIETTFPFSYNFDGKSYLSHKYPSAFLECPFKDLPIERDTLVWYRDIEVDSWRIGYYSHFENGQHFCFINSKKSTETSISNSWNIVTTENPLSC